MKQTFKSKIGLELIIPFAFLLFPVLLLKAVNDLNAFTVVFTLLVIAFILHLIFTTQYTIEGDVLTVKSSFLVNRKIDIKTITTISETNNPISSPAVSLDRLELRHSSQKWVLVSPANKQGFISALRAINPDIEVNYKKDRKS